MKNPNFRLFLQWILSVIVGGYTILVFTLDLSSVKTWLGEQLSQALTVKVGSKVEIGKVDIGLSADITIHDFVIKDKEQEPLLKSDLLFVKIDIFSLLSEKIVIRSIALLDAEFNIYRSNESSKHNFQYIIDAFENQSDNPSNIHLRVNSCILRRCALRYDIHTAPKGSERLFNPQHFYLSDISANISLKHLTTDSIDIRIRGLGLKEKSGFVLKEFRLKGTANRRKANIKDITIQTPHSIIQHEQLSLAYEDFSPHVLWRTLLAYGKLTNVHISSKDLAFFVPFFQNIHEEFFLSAAYVLTPQKFRFQNLEFKTRTDLIALKAGITLNRSKGGFRNLYAQVERLLINFRRLQQYPFIQEQENIPKWLSNLTHVQIVGNGTFSPQNISKFKGNIQTNIGNIKSDLYLRDKSFWGEIQTKDFQPNLLLDNPHLPSHINATIQGKISLHNKILQTASLSLNVQNLQWRNRKYQQLLATARFQQQHGLIDLDFHDPSIQLRGSIESNLTTTFTPSMLRFNIQAQKIVPKDLGFTQRWKNDTFSFQLQGSFDPQHLYKTPCSLQISNFQLSNADRRVVPYYMRHLNFSTTPLPDGVAIQLNSDFLDAHLQGIRDIEDIKMRGRKVIDLLKTHIDSTHTVSFSNLSPSTSPLLFAFRLKRIDFLQRVLHLDIRATDPVYVQGQLSPHCDDFSLTAHSSSLAIGENAFEDLSISSRVNRDTIQLLAKGKKRFKNALLQVEFLARSKEHHLHTQLQWKEQKKNHFHGKFEAQTAFRFNPRNNDTSFNLLTEILPTTLIINDSVWNVEAGQVLYDNKRLLISNFALSHANQRIAVAGSYARGTEGIVVDLKNVDVGYALSLTGLEVITFSGSATGRGILKPALDGSLQLAAYLDVPYFHFNDAYLGHAEIKGSFDGRDQTIHFDSSIKEPNISQTQVKGYVSLGKKMIDLNVESQQTSIAFLNKYVNDIFQQVRGRTSGHCRIFGNFREIDFEGRQRAFASAKIGITGVTYHLSDADVLISPGNFRFLNVQVTDSIKGHGMASGTLQHDHLNNMTYQFNLQGQHLKLYDKPYELDMPFYATAYGTGIASISGMPGHMEANLVVDTEENTLLTYLLDSPESTDQKLLTLRSSTPQATDTITPQLLPDSSSTSPPSTDIRLNLDINVHPSSQLRMITDAKSGDVITIRGKGAIQATYYNKGTFQMFGTYNVEQGIYDLSIQNFIKKNFNILPGGVVKFSGNPLNADVDVRASYFVNSASLADLNIGAGFRNNTTPVNCLIHFTGKVNNMNLVLDFDLPNVGEDEKAMLRSMMVSEEDRTMQVLYLLSMGRFFTYDYDNTQSAVVQSQSSVMMKSLLSSTLSSQINNILSNAVGSSNWTFGANVATGQLGWSDMEVDGSLSGRILNNRLLINGKVGYHERQSATTNFVGDFDVQYLLNTAGTISLKAYSETNDRYFSKSTLSTQGLGLQLKHDFSSFRKLFFPRRNPIISKQ